MQRQPTDNSVRCSYSEAHRCVTSGQEKQHSGRASHVFFNHLKKVAPPSIYPWPRDRRCVAGVLPVSPGKPSTMAKGNRWDWWANNKWPGKMLPFLLGLKLLSAKTPNMGAAGWHQQRGPTTWDGDFLPCRETLGLRVSPVRGIPLQQVLGLGHLFAPTGLKLCCLTQRPWGP